ncbi:MAG: hypothetical protein JWO06_2519 [Bacteroidota bacterium]|nr:hypothetical protein [Bacteroidota bacterium]
MGKIVSSILVLLGSILKFSVGSFTAMAANLGLEGSIANIIGGIIGIVLFTYLGGVMKDYFVKRFPNMFGRKFTRSNRFLVRIKQRFGLGGIAALTPIVLSIPVGVLFALAFTTDKKKIMLSMIMSIMFWATALFLPYFLFNINIFDWLKRVFG